MSTPSDEDNVKLEASKSINVVQPCRKSIYCVFMLLGVACLLPFNCVIVPVDFWMRFYQPEFLSAASFAFNIGNWCTMIFMLFKGYKLNQTILIVIPLFTWLVCLIIIPIIHPIISDKLTKTIVTLIPIVVSGIAVGAFQPTVYSLGARLNPLYNQAVGAGNGIAGLIPQFILIIIKIIVTLTNTSEEEYEKTLYIQTIAYFIIGALVIILCIIAFKWLTTQFEYKEQPVNETQNEQINNTVSYKQLFKQLRFPVTTITLLFLVTLSIFPTITIQIPFNTYARKNKLNLDKQWWSVGMMTTFMIFDYVGRQITVFKFFAKLSLKAGLIVGVVRFAFYIFFLMAFPKYVCEQNICTQGPLIKSDTLSILTMILFSLSNGWLCSTTMMKYHTVLEDPDTIKKATSIQTFMLNTGLLTGCLLSLLINIAFNQ